MFRCFLQHETVVAVRGEVYLSPWLAQENTTPYIDWTVWKSLPQTFLLSAAGKEHYYCMY